MRLRPAVALLVLGISASHAAAIDLHRKFVLGVRVGDWLAADSQGGGFRGFGGNLDRGERSVHLGDAMSTALSLGYGVAKVGKKAEMTIELQVERVSTTLGAETVYEDPDASTRIQIPPFPGTAQSGDERFTRLTVGDVTLTPVFASALFHWNSPGGRGGFYCGGGPGVVLAQGKESREFREFKSDFDGTDDFKVGDAFGLIIKAGADVRLNASGNWLMFFEAEFISTGFLTSQPQARWSGSDYFAGEQVIDTDNNGIPDLGVHADLRIVDPGSVRMDGASLGIGIRYRFGGRAKATQPTEAAETESSEPAKP